MKRLNCSKIQLALFVLMFLAFNANAQKLPKVQTASVYAPGNIKIDGRATEWGGTYQAYNHIDHLFYSMANDDKNIYLVVSSSDQLSISKMVRWGIALTINGTGKRKSKDPNNVVVSFPVADEKRNLGIIHSMGEKDILVNKTTMMNSRNAKIANVYKLIEVSGIKEISEPTISIYNTTGIKTGSLFDNKLAYVYELAIPLKYLGTSINNGARFSYNIKLNGGILKNGAAMPMRVDGGPTPTQDYLFSPTDFWGEYTLARQTH
ncbi:hypothetical protein [Mucilaginibacter sp.]|uniref:hypothetical protein n=1 Tax=Mucilaginibacter sp. TaxID=1882438 RepID=UPI00261F7B9C|nr:hypothetical protein [Mucilaginibacter sp.]MDB5030278.1 hypothetical protein [Mucilaginibacter sp.]